VPRPPRGLLLLGVAAIVAGALHAGGAQQTQYFPHERHARLFPTCAGCHAGIATGNRAEFYPPPALCAQCHNGRVRAPVEWEAPHRTPTNVVFSHPAHDSASRAGGQPIECGRCHSATGAPAPSARMLVTRARPELCITCHAHAAPAHLAQTVSCRRCHVPIAAATGVPADTIAIFPQPATHADSGFVMSHGATARVAEVQARCAICHARESCTRCHPNAAHLPAIAALQSDRRVAAVVASKAPRWPKPPSHRDPDWIRAHGALAVDRIQTCANCHTQPGCLTCHVGEGANVVIAALPLPGPGMPGGALARTGPGGSIVGSVSATPGAGRPLAREPIADAAAPPSLNRVHPAGFATRHGNAAALSDPTCSACHQRTFCIQCHQAATRPVFHPPAYLTRHAADAYAATTDCQSCHNTVAFCRACHRGAGLQAQGRTDVAFHTAQPLWLLQHGAAAREGLEECASCHAEQTCMRCHSTITQHVDPHGPGFDAATMAKKAPLMCAKCHIGPPPTR
jgi:predicted CXXCH cytochrome family protein